MPLAVRGANRVITEHRIRSDHEDRSQRVGLDFAFFVLERLHVFHRDARLVHQQFLDVAQVVAVDLHGDFRAALRTERSDRIDPRIGGREQRSLPAAGKSQDSNHTTQTADAAAKESGNHEEPRRREGGQAGIF